MKKILLFGIFSVLLSLGIYSCHDRKGAEEPINSNITPKSMEFVGIEHNQLLEESFQFLRKGYNSKNLSNRNTLQNKQSLENFLISKIQSNNKYSITSNKLGAKNIKTFFDSSKNMNQKEDYSLQIPNEIRLYLKDLDIILNQIDFNKKNDIEDKISALEEKINKDNNLSDKNRIIIFSATQTARYSYDYWKKNIYKWESLNSNKKEENLILLKYSTFDNSEKDPKDNGTEHGKDIVKADVAGAVGGAVGAVVINVIPGAGQVGYGGAIIGGAVAGSVAEGAKKLLDWAW